MCVCVCVCVCVRACVRSHFGSSQPSDTALHALIQPALRYGFAYSSMPLTRPPRPSRPAPTDKKRRWSPSSLRTKVEPETTADTIYMVEPETEADTAKVEPETEADTAAGTPAKRHCSLGCTSLEELRAVVEPETTADTAMVEPETEADTAKVEPETTADTAMVEPAMQLDPAMQLEEMLGWYDPVLILPLSVLPVPRPPDHPPPPRPRLQLSTLPVPRPPDHPSPRSSTTFPVVHPPRSRDWPYSWPVSNRTYRPWQ